MYEYMCVYMNVFVDVCVYCVCVLIEQESLFIAT